MIREIAYWSIGAIIVLSFVADVLNLRRESSSSRRITELEQRISNLETLVAQSEDPDYLNEIQGFEV